MGLKRQIQLQAVINNDKKKKKKKKNMQKQLDRYGKELLNMSQICKYGKYGMVLFESVIGLRYKSGFTRHWTTFINLSGEYHKYLAKSMPYHICPKT